MTKQIEHDLIDASVRHKRQATNLETISRRIKKSQPRNSRLYSKMARSLLRSARKHQRQALRLSALRHLTNINTKKKKNTKSGKSKVPKKRTKGKNKKKKK